MLFSRILHTEKKIFSKQMRQKIRSLPKKSRVLLQFIFGNSIHRIGCSRKVEELKSNGRIDVTLHCTEEGNFDILQCDSGVCWCADEYTGEALGEVVPQPMMEMLPCCEYTSTLHNRLMAILAKRRLA
jgi:Thyroglobulin type-1 repeat